MNSGSQVDSQNQHLQPAIMFMDQHTLALFWQELELLEVDNASPFLKLFQ